MQEKINRKVKKMRDLYIRPLFYEKCKITNDDIIFASFQKSGRTWVRFFIANYIVAYYKINENISWNNFVNYSPGYLCNSETGLLNYPKGIPRIIFSHDKYIGNFFPNRKTILLTRNIYDIIISYFHFHKTRSNEIVSNDINNFARNEFNYNYLIDKLNFFGNKLKKAEAYKIIRYEDLLEEDEEIFKEVIGFSNFDFDSIAFKYAIDKSNFNHMQKLEKKQKKLKGEELHTRKAEKGQYENKMNADTIEIVKGKIEKKLNNELKNYYLL